MDAATLNAEWLRRYDRALELDKWGQMEEARECYKKLREYIDTSGAPYMCVRACACVCVCVCVCVRVSLSVCLSVTAV